MSSVAIVQMTSTANFEENLSKALSYIEEGSRLKTDLIAFPENFLLIGDPAVYRSGAVPDENRVRHIFQQKAAACNISILMGSILEKATAAPGKYFNTSILIDRKGLVCAQYRKIHLFDITHPEVVYSESAHIVPGQEITCCHHDIGQIGLSICYDVRFPSQYQRLRAAGAEIITVPAAFTVPTGKAHWLTLLQARAIENQVFIIAPAQYGKHSETRASYGNSVLIDPWGEILAHAADGEKMITGEIDLVRLQKTRERMPVFKHRVKGIDDFNND
ncbi:carbon-nitrogen hydrolase family protein [bacterium]|nr:carbon-nitrogen hydrolase family protein [bacterium]